jgi:hypothetical protein
MKPSHLRSIALSIAALCVLPITAVAQSAGETAAWESTKAAGSADQLKAFLDAYPAGQFAPEARQKYSVVANTMLPAQVQHIDIQFPGEARRIGRTLGPVRVAKLNILVQQDGKASDVKLVTSSGFDPMTGRR